MSITNKGDILRELVKYVLDSQISIEDGKDVISGACCNELEHEDGTFVIEPYVFRCHFRPVYPGCANWKKSVRPIDVTRISVAHILSSMDEWKGKEDSAEFRNMVQKLEKLVPKDDD